MINFDADALCDCGRLKAKRHCTKCGSASGYALSRRATIQDPSTGIMHEVNIYRCRNCNNYYNDYDRDSNCKAPEYMSAQEAKHQRDDLQRTELMNRVRNHDKLDHIDKLKFRRVVGMTYEAFRIMTESAKRTIGSAPIITEPQEVIKETEPEIESELEIEEQPKMPDIQLEQMANQAQQHQSKEEVFRELIKSAKNYKPKAPPPNSTEGFK